MGDYSGKYRKNSLRLQNWDYGWSAAYFITICTKNRVYYFGEIKNKIMQLSPVGVIADVLWHEIKNHAKNMELGAFIVMPNHIHGILILNGNNKTDGPPGNDIDRGDGGGRARHALPLPPSSPSSPPPSNSPPNPPKTIGQQRFQNQGKNTLSSIIGSYKSAVTRHAHRLSYRLDWQRGFHDHVIRAPASHARIARYIENNPANWSDDSFNPRNPEK